MQNEGPHDNYLLEQQAESISGDSAQKTAAYMYERFRIVSKWQALQNEPEV